jgi:hypothetical protein
VRVTEAEAHGGVDVRRGGEALVGDRAGGVDDGREQALRDHPRPVSDDGDGQSGGGERGPRRAPELRVQSGMDGQGQPVLEGAELVDPGGAPGRESTRDSGIHCGLPVRREQHDGVR